jgi:hypothetical protein
LDHSGGQFGKPRFTHLSAAIVDISRGKPTVKKSPDRGQTEWAG